MAECSSLNKENLNLRSEIQDLKKDLQSVINEKDLFKSKLKESDQMAKAIHDKYEAQSKDIDIMTSDLQALQKKLVEGEYMAYCYSLRSRSNLGDLQQVQLVLRKNCRDEPIFEFEDKNGDLRIIRADLISDVESDETDSSAFFIKYSPFGCFGYKTQERFECENRGRVIFNIKTFLEQAQDGKAVVVGAPVTYQRSMIEDLRMLFFA